MEFNYRYSGTSSVVNSPNSTGLSFAPDTFREPTFFIGKLNKHLPFREAISALHHIVVSNYRYQPKDNTAYLEWLKKQEVGWLAEERAKSANIARELEEKQAKLRTIQRERSTLMKPFYDARSKYYRYLLKRDYTAWLILDPVITVHPDSLFFECFSKDESSYGKLSCNYNVFKELDEFACGTTNIDYSKRLYDEFQKIRDYKETSFAIDPSGFEVQTGVDEGYKEVKIDLPETWVRGFLQVSAAMTLPAHVFDLHPMDMNNFLFILKRHKEKEGPRSIRFLLEPGQAVKAVFEPWNKIVTCPRSIYKGNQSTEVRLWGRRRLLLLERLVAVAKSFRVTLLGSGLPSFFEANLGDMTFTLGLSGWTANDWTRAGNFELMMPRKDIDGLTQQKVYAALRKDWLATSDDLAKNLNLSKAIVESALFSCIQAGKVVYDIKENVYRIRELAKDDLPVEELRYNSPQEEKAAAIVAARGVKVLQRTKTSTHEQISGKITDQFKTYETTIYLDLDERLVKAQCTCRFYKNNKLHKGPCEHILALRNRVQ